MEVNIIGVMNGTEIALERMKKQPKKGTIVNTASMAGIMTGKKPIIEESYSGGATNIGCGVLKQPPPGEGGATSTSISGRILSLSNKLDF